MSPLAAVSVVAKSIEASTPSCPAEPSPPPQSVPPVLVAYTTFLSDTEKSDEFMLVALPTTVKSPPKATVLFAPPKLIVLSVAPPPTAVHKSLFVSVPVMAVSIEILSSKSNVIALAPTEVVILSPPVKVAFLR